MNVQSRPVSTGGVPELSDSECKHQLILGGLNNPLTLELERDPVVTGTLLIVGIAGAMCSKCGRQFSINYAKLGAMRAVPLAEDGTIQVPTGGERSTEENVSVRIAGRK